MADIRPLGVEDAAAWWHLRLQALEDEPFAFGRAAQEHRAMTLDDVVARFRDLPPTDVHLGAFVDSELVGTATFIRETGLKERHKGHVYGVYVRAAWRRDGVARAMFTALLAFARADTALETLLLSVAIGQAAARALYRSFGFVPYGVEPRSLKVGDAYIDEELLVLRLHEASAGTDPLGRC